MPLTVDAVIASLNVAVTGVFAADAGGAGRPA